MPAGRPTTYSQELSDKICEQLALGKSMRTICKSEDMPCLSTIYKWIRENIEFSQQYAKAKEDGSDAIAEEMFDIADDGSNDYMTITKGDKSYNVEDREVTNRSRLRVDVRKWYLSKIKPKKYGEKVDVTSDGKAIKGNTIIFKDFSDETASE